MPARSGDEERIYIRLRLHSLGIRYSRTLSFLRILERLAGGTSDRSAHPTEIAVFIGSFPGTTGYYRAYAEPR